MGKTPSDIISEMFDHDGFSKWLGIKRVKEELGHVILEMKVNEEMLNGFGIAHGGISYSLADSALAFASNSHGKKAYSIETSISHLQKVKPGDILRAEAKEIHRTYKTGLYEVRVTNQNGELVAIFKGTVYVSSKDW